VDRGGGLGGQRELTVLGVIGGCWALRPGIGLAEDDRRFSGYARTLAARTPAGPAALHIAPGADHGTGMLPDPTAAGGTVANR